MQRSLYGYNGKLIMKKIFISCITFFIILTCAGCISNLGKPHTDKTRQLMDTVIYALEENDTEVLLKVLSKDLQDKCTDIELTKIVNSIPSKITKEEYFIVDDASEYVDDPSNISGDYRISKYYLSCIVDDENGVRYKIKLEYTKSNKFDVNSEGITYVGVTPITLNDTAMDTISIGTRTALSI